MGPRKSIPLENYSLMYLTNSVSPFKITWKDRKTFKKEINHLYFSSHRKDQRMYYKSFKHCYYEPGDEVGYLRDGEIVIGRYRNEVVVGNLFRSPGLLKEELDKIKSSEVCDLLQVTDLQDYLDKWDDIKILESTLDKVATPKEVTDGFYTNKYNESFIIKDGVIQKLKDPPYFRWEVLFGPTRFKRLVRLIYSDPTLTKEDIHLINRLPNLLIKYLDVKFKHTNSDL